MEISREVFHCTMNFGRTDAAEVLSLNVVKVEGLECQDLHPYLRPNSEWNGNGQLSTGAWPAEVERSQPMIPIYL